MAFKLKELNGELGEVIANITLGEGLMLTEESERGYQIWLEPDYLHIEELGLKIFSGERYVYNSETKELGLSSSLYQFYRDGTGENVYSESGSGLAVCIYNYCNLIGVAKTMEEVENLQCTYQLDNGKFLREKVISWMDVEIEGQIEI